jgi:hypothetical protein
MHVRKILLRGTFFALLIAAGIVGIVARTKMTALAAPVVIKDRKLMLLDTELGEKRLPTAGDVQILFDRHGGWLLYGGRWEGAQADSEDTGGTRLRIMREDGTGDRSVSEEPVRFAFFGKDGKQIYYLTREDAFLTADSVGGPSRLLARNVSFPDVSTDGKRAVYKKLDPQATPGAYEEQALGIAVLDLRTGDERVIDPDPDAFNPVWSPDGRRIVYFSVSPEGLASQFMMDADGKGRRQVTNIGQKTVTGATVPVPSERPLWSSDGRYLVYESDRQIWVNEYSADRDRVASSRAIGYGIHPEWAEDGKAVRVLVGKDGDLGIDSTIRLDLRGNLYK